MSCQDQSPYRTLYRLYPSCSQCNQYLLPLYHLQKMSSAMQILKKIQPSVLTLPLWSSSASLMTLSMKVLKRVEENRHPCRTPTEVLKQSPVLPSNKTAHLALLYRFLITCMMLALKLYFLKVTHWASFAKLCQTPYFKKNDAEIIQIL